MRSEQLFYNLDEDGRTPIACEAQELAWDDDSRIVGRTYVGIIPRRRTLVSTVFLGIDHSFGDDGGPVLFETLVRSQWLRDDMLERYETWDEANEGHKKWVKVTRCRRYIAVALRLAPIVALATAVYLFVPFR